MKAVQLVEPGEPLQMQNIPLPKIGTRDLLVEVKAAGICHSDVHYRAGVSHVEPLPLTLGHEVAGVVKKVGAEVSNVSIGDRVCLHYMVSCGDCYYCTKGNEQFCPTGKMLGNHRHGGYAEYIDIPARNAFLLPDSITFEQGAIMMCSSATSFHALRKGRLQAGESVAVFGAGGLGMSAIQLARAMGALDVIAVDINPRKLELAWELGAIPVNAGEDDPVTQIRRLTAGRGVDVALELIGLPLTMQQSFESLALGGRAVIAGITGQSLEIAPYKKLICRETEIIGCSDHLAQELPTLIEFAERGRLDLSGVATDTVPLDADVINEVMDSLENFGGNIRVVIVP